MKQLLFSLLAATLLFAAEDTAHHELFSKPVHDAVADSHVVVQAELIQWPEPPAPPVMQVKRILGYPAWDNSVRLPMPGKHLLLTEFPEQPICNQLSEKTPTVGDVYFVAFTSHTRAAAVTGAIRAKAHCILATPGRELIEDALRHADRLNLLSKAPVFARVQHGKGTCISRKNLNNSTVELEYMMKCTVLEAYRGCTPGQKICYVFNCAEHLDRADAVGGVRDFSSLGTCYLGSNRQEEITHRPDGTIELLYNRLDAITETTVNEYLKRNAGR